MKFTTKQLTQTAILLALCVASQFIKNTSVYVTGAIVNSILIIATLVCGLSSGVIISVVSPVTSWLITGSPLISALPVLMPCIMLGNLVLVLSAHYLKEKITLPGSLIAGSALKAFVMWGLMVKVVLALFFSSTGLPAPALAVAKVNFSTTQLITALIGSLVSLIVLKPLQRYVVK